MNIKCGLEFVFEQKDPVGRLSSFGVLLLTEENLAIITSEDIRERRTNKAEIMEEVADKVGITKKEAGNIIDAAVETITNTLSKGEKVTLVGFGTFQVLNRKARRGRNPRTGEELQIPAKKVPKFRPGKKLREKVIR